MGSPERALGLLWTAWAVSWFAAAFWSDRAAKRAAFGSELPYRITVLAGVALLFGLGAAGRHPGRLWTAGPAASWAGVATAACGFLFCWWARLHLGRLWSAWVTSKSGHRVVDTGPYRLVRHPIYTGLLTAAYATAAVKGGAVSFAGALLMTAGFWMKARLEERFLARELGAEAYEGYRRRVPMLLPFGPASS